MMVVDLGRHEACGHPALAAALQGLAEELELASDAEEVDLLRNQALRVRQDPTLHTVLVVPHQLDHILVAIVRMLASGMGLAVVGHKLVARGRPLDELLLRCLLLERLNDDLVLQ